MEGCANLLSPASKRLCTWRDAAVQGSEAPAEVSTTTVRLTCRGPSGGLQLTELSNEVLMKIASFVGAWGTFRACARGLRDAADRGVKSLRVSACTPKPVLMQVLERLRGLRRLDLSNAAAVDDEVVLLALGRSTAGLQHLNLSFCHGVSPGVEPWLHKVAQVVTRGCWRLSRPCPSLSAEAVLELQLLALQLNDPAKDDGVATHFAFFARAPGTKTRRDSGHHRVCRTFSAIPDVVQARLAIAI